MLGVPPLKKHMKKNKEKRATFLTLWWQVDMKMSVRFGRRLQKWREQEKQEKNIVHPVSALAVMNFDPSVQRARYLPASQFRGKSVS